ncbi:MAG: hypothetical protein Fur0040_00210 [Sideroxydans sp.]
MTYPNRSVTYYPEGSMMNSFTVHSLPWESCSVLVNEVRVAASIARVISHLDALPDDRDATARHAIALDKSGKVLGCGRLTEDGLIERIVVMPHDRVQLIRAAMTEILRDDAARMKQPRKAA